MISLNELNIAYINLYTALRNYIWDIHTVENLAELEIATYDRFPDLDKVNKYFNQLKVDVTNSDVYSEDEELQEAMEEFEEQIDNQEILYSPLVSLNVEFDETEQPLIKPEKEDIDNGHQDYKDTEEESEESDSINKEDKKLFNIEHISKSSANTR